MYLEKFIEKNNIKTPFGVFLIYREISIVLLGIWAVILIPAEYKWMTRIVFRGNTNGI